MQQGLFERSVSDCHRDSQSVERRGMRDYGTVRKFILLCVGLCKLNFHKFKHYFDDTMSL